MFQSDGLACIGVECEGTRRGGPPPPTYMKSRGQKYVFAPPTIIILIYNTSILFK